MIYINVVQLYYRVCAVQQKRQLKYAAFEGRFDWTPPMVPEETPRETADCGPPTDGVLLHLC